MATVAHEVTEHETTEQWGGLHSALWECLAEEERQGGTERLASGGQFFLDNRACDLILQYLYRTAGNSDKLTAVFREIDRAFDSFTRFPSIKLSVKDQLLVEVVRRIFVDELKEDVKAGQREIAVDLGNTLGLMH